jgi:hypothetical protein
LRRLQGQLSAVLGNINANPRTLKLLVLLEFVLGGGCACAHLHSSNLFLRRNA